MTDTDAWDERRAHALATLQRRTARLRARSLNAPPERRAHLIHTADQLGRLAHLLAHGAEDAAHAEAWIEATEHI